MKKRIGLRILCMLLAAAMLLAAVPAAMAAKDGETGSMNFEFNNWPWFYVPSTVPRQFTRELYPHPLNLFAYSGGAPRYMEKATSVQIEFVSGDEHLRDALVAVEYGGNDDGVDYPGYQVKLEKVREPGTAIFHVTADSERYHYEKDVPLRVLSWEEYPLFTYEQKTEPETVTARPGEVVPASRFMEFFTVEDHSAEIAEMLSQNGEKVEPLHMGTDISFYNTETEWGGLQWRDAEDGYPARSEEGAEVEGLYDYGTDEFLSFRFNCPGTYEVYYTRTDDELAANVQLLITTGEVRVLPYSIRGPEFIVPGETAEYTVADQEPESGRTFTMSLEGAGAALEGEDGAWRVRAAEDAESGTSFTLAATPSDGGEPTTLKVTVQDGVLAGIPTEIMEIEMGQGFSVPVFSTADGEYESGVPGFFTNRLLSQPANRDVPYFPALVYTVRSSSLFLHREDAENHLRQYILEEYFEGCEADFQGEEMIEVLGEPALICTGVAQTDGQQLPFGLLYMVKNSSSLELAAFMYDGKSGAGQGKPGFTLTDMKLLAGQIQYDESKASMTLADAAVTVSAKKGETEITGGKKVQLQAAFGNPDKINLKSKNNGVEWSVIDLETGEAPADVTIDSKGSLSAKKDLAAVRKLRVKAVSTKYSTEGTYDITAIPAVKKVTVDPAELFFYVGTEEAQTVKAVLDPDTVPPTGITWTPAKKNLLEIEPAEDGTARIRPLSAGKTTVAVKEPGGKNAKLTVSIVEPVTEVTLAAKGKAQPGKTVTVTAALAPKNAGNRNLEWSLDVDETVAAIDAKGRVKIDKNAAAGTAITVTCRALGAPEPVTATLEITVE